MGVMLMESPESTDISSALQFFLKSVLHDTSDTNDIASHQKSQLLKAQYAKAYYNLGLIYDIVADIPNAALYYKKAIDKNLRH